MISNMDINRRKIWGTICYYTSLITVCCMCVGCMDSGESIVFIPTDTYDPYPMHIAYRTGKKVGEDRYIQAIKIVAEAYSTARCNARSMEYTRFIERSSDWSYRKPRSYAPVDIGGAININTASSPRLQKLPRVGPATAKRIIENRPFSAVGDLLEIRGIGPKTMERLRPHITVSSH